MGVSYSIVCTECKVSRDLDKFYSAYEIKTRDQAMRYRVDLQQDLFRVGLLVSFMAEHKDHKCVFLNDYDGNEEYEPFLNSDYEEDTNFWIEPSG